MQAHEGNIQPNERKRVIYGLLFSGLLIGLALVIAACVLYAPIPLHVPKLVYQLNAAITAYKTGSFAKLSGSTFALRVSSDAGTQLTRNMSWAKDSYSYSTIQQIPFVSKYTAKVFSASIPVSQLVRDNDVVLARSLIVNITSAYAGHVNILSISVPFLKIFPEGQPQLYILSSICAQIEMDTTKHWILAPSEGCVYPFNDIGEYTQVKNNSVASLSNYNVSFFVRPIDDPYIILGQLSNGALNFIVPQTPAYVINLSIAGSFIIAVLLIVSVYYTKQIYNNQSFITRPHVFRYLGVFSVSMIVAAGIGLVLVNHWTSEPYWLWSPFLGVWVLILFCPTAVFSIMLFWANIIKTPWTSGLRFGLSISSSFVIIATCGLGLWLLVKPGNFQIGVFKHQVDLTMMFTGIFFSLVLVPMALLNLAVCGRTLLRLRNGDEYKPAFNRQPSNRAQKNGYIWIVAFGILVVVSVFSAALFMPPKYNKAVIPKPLNAVFNNYTNYLDIVAFYGYVMITICVFILTSLFKPIYDFFHIWIKLRLRKYEVYTTSGEVFLLVGYGAFVAWWTYYWMVLNAPTSVTQAEAVAIGFGQITNLFVATLLFPVTRNSMWVQLIGVPFERAVKYHRWLGRFTLMAFTAHMVSYWVVWARAKTLVHNMFSLQNIPYTTFWSVPMMELLWVGSVICMGTLSYSWIRRNKFEVFYYAHHFATVVFIVAMLHSSRGWYFFSAGLILWFVDRLLRFWRGSKAYRVLSLKNHEGITELTIEQSGFRYCAGQYAFINIPTISALEWHPFSISSAPDENVVTFHIKSMPGNLTWTSRLRELCEQAYCDEREVKDYVQMPVVNIDGPYGAPPSFNTASVMLVGGGIGITPLISVFKDLVWHPPKTLKHITLLWVVRDSIMFNMFRDCFIKILAIATPQAVVDIVLYSTTQCSTDTGKEQGDGKLTPTFGRPKVCGILNSITERHGKDGVSVMVCAPAGLVHETREACYSVGVTRFYCETFVL